MSEHRVVVRWQRHQAKFIDNKYSREHCWALDGGAEIMASASPHVVPVPYANAAYIDPEEAFVASLSSCHMLWFLSIAAKQKFVVDSYTDQAVGLMARTAASKLAITQVTLRPQVVFGGEYQPSNSQMAAIHEEAHQSCFIANSVKTEVVIEPVMASEHSQETGQ